MRNTLAAWSKLFSIKLELIGVEILSLVFDVAVCERVVFGESEQATKEKSQRLTGKRPLAVACLR